MIILGHEKPDVDSVISGYLLEKLLKNRGYDVEFIIPDKYVDSETNGICMKYGLNPSKFIKDLPKEKSEYILVDHSDREVNGEIVLVLDHHPKVRGKEIEHYYNEEISSTSLLITKGNEKEFSTNDLRLSFLAAYVDTASFHSTKGRKEDEEYIKKICIDKDIDYEELYKEGLCLTEVQDIPSTSLNGLKKYNFDNIIFESSYVQLEGTIVDKHTISEIINYLKNYYINISNVDYFVFIAHDMTKFKTDAYVISKDNVRVINYDQYTSRGETIIPEVRDEVLSKRILEKK